MNLSEIKKYSIYFSILSTALLLIILLASKIFSLAILLYPILILLGISLIGFGISGISDVYSYQLKNLAGTSSPLPLIKAEIQRPHDKGEGSVLFRLSRFNYQNKQLEEKDYSINIDKFTTILSGLLDIKSNQDPTLSVRYSCRMGICGSCGMVVNGKPVLACETNATESVVNGKIDISPMLGHPLLKDLVTDFGDFFEKHESVNPNLYRVKKDEKYQSDKDFKQSKEELDAFLPFSYCIMCGLCLDACPVINTNPEFIGPQALSQVYRYNNDSRDQKGNQRLKQIDNEMGAWGCEFSGSCSKACPKGVDPASAIQMLKGDILKNKISGSDEKE